MRYLGCINGLFLFCFFVLGSILLYHVNYLSLIDTVYYVDAAYKSESIVSAFNYGSNWFTDVGFIFLSYTYRMITADVYSLAWLFSFGIFTLINVGLLKYINSIFFFPLLLMVFFSFSTVGILFNVWRQGYAEVFILLSALFGSRATFFSVLACFFHLNSAVLFLVPAFFKDVNKVALLRVALFAIICLCFFSYLFFSNFTFFENSFDAYAKTESSSPMFRFFYVIFNLLVTLSLLSIFSSLNIRLYLIESYLIKLIFFIIAISLIYLLLMPAASERFLHYFFLIYPFLLAELFDSLEMRGKFIVLMVSVFHFSLILYFLFESSTWQMLHVNSFL